ncbi:hypothetical protein KORDIASMS9_00505 [Kordia sp. SMS9]|uniref:hypothetical protein n=1 Tax=Kordia sp. SMS9 TaxID=2282170 RepID=UPI000E0D25E1|nr:hypothetical protein [Kordia sp. SMS9]AXG68311.1 hypothetical protein KORDIASMS9_00505 [Kordia sp. SMS9]
MKKKKLQSLQLNKKVVSSLHAEKTQGGAAAGTLFGGPCPGSVGGPCTSIQIPCTYETDCLITLQQKECIEQKS